MHIFVPIIFLVSMTSAEPPVGDGYPVARSSHDHYHDIDHTDHNAQHSLSEKYGSPPFASSRNEPFEGYSASNARSSQNVIGRSQFAAPKVRVSFNQRFSSSAARNSAKVNSTPTARKLTQGYSESNAISGISQEYSTPTARSLSKEYGTPNFVSARTLSTEYGMPDARSTPSQEYGVPIVGVRSNQKPQVPAINFRSSQSAKSLSQDYPTHATGSHFQTDSSSLSNSGPSTRFNEAQGYKAFKSFSNSALDSRRAPSSKYGAPSVRSESTSYSSPSARNFESGDLISQSYGAPSQNDLSESFSQSAFKNYGVPSSRSSQITDAVGSSYTPARSTPASAYLPSARDAVPSQQYGEPEQDKQEGYNYAKARALDELLNQEPANYDFSYQIEDQESGNDFGHTETREDGRAHGSYFVVLPDGTKQTVEYEADERGFKPRISVEPAAGGYDDNAADNDLARSAGGPY